MTRGKEAGSLLNGTTSHSQQQILGYEQICEKVWVELASIFGINTAKALHYHIQEKDGLSSDAIIVNPKRIAANLENAFGTASLLIMHAIVRAAYRANNLELGLNNQTDSMSDCIDSITLLAIRVQNRR